MKFGWGQGLVCHISALSGTDTTLEDMLMMSDSLAGICSSFVLSNVWHPQETLLYPVCGLPKTVCVLSLQPHQDILLCSVLDLTRTLLFTGHHVAIFSRSWSHMWHFIVKISEFIPYFIFFSVAIPFCKQSLICLILFIFGGGTIFGIVFCFVHQTGRLESLNPCSLQTPLWRTKKCKQTKCTLHSTKVKRE